MGGDHKCPVCGSTFTRSQHVARHMRSHTGDRPYKCVHCGDQFARSDLLSRHVNKCHTNEKKAGPANGNGRRKGRQLSDPSTTGTATTNNHPQLDSNGIGGPSGLLGDIGSLPNGPLFSSSILNGYHPRLGTNPTDPYSASASIYSQSPASSARRYSLTQSIGEGIDMPSLSSSSSASASLDSLPHEPIFQLPPNHPPYTQSYPMDGYNRTYAPHQSQALYSHSQPQHQPQSQFGTYSSAYDPNSTSAMDGMRSKQEPGSSSLYPGAFQSTSIPYNDLPTPLAYPSGPYRGGVDPFGPPQPTIGSQPPPQSSHHTSQQQQQGQSHQSPPNLNLSQSQTRYLFAPQNSTALGNGRGEGGFSSAFGLMSLEDAAVLAGMANDGVPFFEQSRMGNNQDLGDLHNMMPPHNVQTPNTREKEITALREMWAAFMKDPTAQLRPDGTEMPRPDFPTPSGNTTTNVANAEQDASQGQGQGQIHRRSSSYSSGTNAQAIPHMPMAQQTLQGGANVVKKLEDQVSNPDSGPQNQNQAQAQAQVAHRMGTISADDLKSYEEAVLARKAPVLKMPSKIKTRESPSSGSATATPGTGTSSIGTGPSPPSLIGSTQPSSLPHSASGVLPPLSALSSILPPLAPGSRPGGSSVGGSVGSLLQNTQLLTTAAGASGVPVGTTPNAAMQGLTQSHSHSHPHASMVGMASVGGVGGNPDRPVIAMPRSRSRSRPSTANGTGPPSRPSSATTGISIGPNGMIINHIPINPNSQPPSRPGTASSNASVAAGAPGSSHPQQYGMQQMSPTPSHQSTTGMYSHPHSQPGSRPSTSHAGYSQSGTSGGGGGISNGAMSPSFAYMPPPPSHAPPMPPGSHPGSLQGEYQLHMHMANANANSAGGGGGVPESPITGSNRPAYKRNASQTLEPTSNKRPHYRRGDTNFNPTLSTAASPNGTNSNAMEEDGFDSDVSIGGSEYGGMQNYYHRAAAAAASGYQNGHGHGSTMANMGNMSATSPNFGNPHGSLSPGGGVGGSASSSFAMRRMSEPSSAAPRMIMRRLPPPTGHPQTAIAAAGNPPI